MRLIIYAIYTRRQMISPLAMHRLRWDFYLIFPKDREKFSIGKYIPSLLSVSFFLSFLKMSNWTRYHVLSQSLQLSAKLTLASLPSSHRRLGSIFDNVTTTIIVCLFSSSKRTILLMFEVLSLEPPRLIFAIFAFFPITSNVLDWLH